MSDMDQTTHRIRNFLRNNRFYPLLSWINLRYMKVRNAASATSMGTYAKIVRSVRYHHGDITLTFRVSSSVEVKRVRSTGQIFTLSELDSRLRLGDVFYDIGANIGIFTLPAAKIVGDSGRVVAFEAAPGNYNRLVENAALNGIENVSSFGLALGECNDTVTLNHPTSRMGEGGHSLLPLTGSKSGSSRIMLARLDDIVATWRLPVPQFVKIDVEGAEVGVLKGMATTLADSQLTAIVCETLTAGPRIPSALVTDETVSGILGEFDFREVRRAPAGTGGHYDILFVR